MAGDARETGMSRVAWLRGATFAHRGLHGMKAPGLPIENSCRAFAAARNAGFGIECDVQLSADGQAVVFHDFELDRLTHVSGPVAAHSAEVLAHIPLSGSKDTIPTLAQLLALVAGAVPLLIEVKMKHRLPVAPLCEAVARALDGYSGPHAVMSFDPRVPKWFADNHPDTPRGLVMSNADTRKIVLGLLGPLLRHLALRHARPDFLALDIRDLPNRFAKAQRAHGVPLASWTVRNPELLARALTHVDAAIVEGAGVPHPEPPPAA